MEDSEDLAEPSNEATLNENNDERAWERSLIFLSRSIGDGRLDNERYPTLLRGAHVQWAMERGFSVNRWHPPNGTIRPKGVLSNRRLLLLSRAHEQMYKECRANANAALAKVENFIVRSDVPIDIQVLMADAALPVMGNERVILSLQHAWLLTEKPDCKNPEILKCIIDAHLASVYIHQGNLEEARYHSHRAMILSSSISDCDWIFNVFWVHAWLSSIYNYGTPDGLKTVLSNYKIALDVLQRMEYWCWFRKWVEPFKLATANIWLWCIRQNIEECVQCQVEPKENNEILRHLEMTMGILTSLKIDIIKETGYLDTPYSRIYFHHIWFKYNYFSGRMQEALIHEYQAGASWNMIDKEENKYMDEIAHLLRHPQTYVLNNLN